MRLWLSLKDPSLKESDAGQIEPITSDQCRMARAVPNWTLSDLSIRTGVSVETLGRFERSGNAYPATLSAVREAFEAVSLRFLGGPYLPQLFWDPVRVRALRATVAQLDGPGKVIEHED